MSSDRPRPDAEGPPIDVKRIVAALDRRGVAYLLIAGIGATLYGADRVTQDIDGDPLVVKGRWRRPAPPAWWAPCRRTASSMTT